MNHISLKQLFFAAFKFCDPAFKGVFADANFRDRLTARKIYVREKHLFYSIAKFDFLIAITKKEKE
jgi:hypothetical protein